MRLAAANTSICPRAIFKIAVQITDSRATTDLGRAVPRLLEYWKPNINPCEMTLEIQRGTAHTNITLYR